MEQAARQRRSRGCARAEGHQVGVGEESAGPDPGAAGLVGVAVQDQLGPVPGVPAQGATPAGVLDQGRNRPGTARRVAGLGPTLTAARVRHTRRHDQTVPAADLQHPRSRPVQCTLGSHEHAPTSTDQTRQRISHTRSLHRHGHAHPRRPVPGTAKPPMKTAGGPGNSVVVGTETAAQFIGPATALKSATTSVDVAAATAPTANQVIKASDSTHATWQTLTIADVGLVSSAEYYGYHHGSHSRSRPLYTGGFHLHGQHWINCLYHWRYCESSKSFGFACALVP